MSEVPRTGIHPPCTTRFSSTAKRCTCCLPAAFTGLPARPLLSQTCIWANPNVSPVAAARFCPTGGITPNNYRDYLALKSVLCIGGSWLVPADALEAGDWDRITKLAREAVEGAKQ